MRTIYKYRKHTNREPVLQMNHSKILIYLALQLIILSILINPPVFFEDTDLAINDEGVNLLRLIDFSS